MINLDFIAVDGGVDIRGGGGKLIRNGNELLDEKNGAEKLDLLNQIYPIGSLFFCKTGTGSPASKYGGNWQCLAENVVLPLGSSAPATVSSDGSVFTFTIGGTGGAWSNVVSRSSLSSAGYGNLGVYAHKSINNYDNAYYAQGLKATTNLAGSTNAISGVDVWQRIEEI